MKTDRQYRDSAKIAFYSLMALAAITVGLNIYSLFV